MNPKQNESKVVVTGGAGFIGSHLANTLAEVGYDVHVVDSLVSGKRERLLKNIQLHMIDVRDMAACADIFSKADTVFHLAALPRVQYSIENPLETNDVNIGGTVSVLEAAARAGVRRVVYSASSSAYGDQETLPLHEDMPVRPKSPYGVQKYIGEVYCKTYGEMYGIETVSLRYFNVYGPGFGLGGEYPFVIENFLKQRAEGKPMTITGDGKQTRDFIHVRDVVRANILAMQSGTVGAGEVLNIGAGNETSVNRIAELIGGEMTYIEPRIEPRRTHADNTRAEKLLGWKPMVLLEEGIAELEKEERKKC